MRTRNTSWALVVVGAMAAAGCAAETAPVDLNPQPLPPGAPGLNPQPLPPAPPDEGTPNEPQKSGDTTSVDVPGGGSAGSSSGGAPVPGAPAMGTEPADGGAPPCPYADVFCVRVTNRAKKF